MAGRVEEPPSETVLALEEREKNRVVSSFDVNGFFGPGDRPIPRIGVRTPTKFEQDVANIEARKYVANLVNGSDVSKTEAELIQDAKSAAIVAVTCREMKLVDPAKPDGDWAPTGRKAFPLIDWVCRTIEPDRIGVLVNLLNEHRAKTGPAPITIDDEQMDAIIKVCSEHAGDDIPEAVLAGATREFLTHTVVLLSLKVVALREALAVATNPPPPPVAPEVEEPATS